MEAVLPSKPNEIRTFNFQRGSCCLHHFFSPLTHSNWFLQCSCSPTHVLKQEARGGSCSVAVSCSVFLKHLADTKALIKRSKRASWYTKVQLRVHIAYNRKTLSAPMVTGFLAHGWYFQAFLVNNFLMGTRAILKQVQYHYTRFCFPGYPVEAR